MNLVDRRYVICELHDVIHNGGRAHTRHSIRKIATQSAILCIQPGAMKLVL